MKMRHLRTVNTTLVEILEILGTLAFASSGATRAIRKQYDLFGLFVLAFVTSIGGGTLRDILIGNLPVEWLSDLTLIVTVIAGTVATYLFNRYMHRLRWWVFFFDAVGLGLFTMVGLQKALAFGLSPFIAILLGVITASFGGVIRDILSGEVPLLLRNEIYAFASIAGGVLFFILRYFGLSSEFDQVICVAVIVAIRVLSMRYGWSLRLPLRTDNPSE